MHQGTRTGAVRSKVAPPPSAAPTHLAPSNGTTDGAPKGTSAGTALAIHDLSWLSADVLLAVVSSHHEDDALEFTASIAGGAVEL
jgi:hypothetical protein